VDYGKFSITTIPTILFIYKKNQEDMKDLTGHREETGQARRKGQTGLYKTRGGGGATGFYYTM
jgi:hypothetical protein